ncbi:hypothetical protein ACT7DZ_18620 [Bacillus cereus]
MHQKNNTKEFCQKWEQKKLVSIYQSILKEKRLLSSDSKKKKKTAPTQNLWNRFVKYDDGILAFLDIQTFHLIQSSGTNIRMTEVKQKVSGTFRSQGTNLLHPRYEAL